MVSVINPKADVLKAAQALAVNLNAAKSLQDVMKTNLGPRGTVKMLVGGAGQIRITKDGKVLLDEMQIQHPTASMIARAATAMDDVVGDGTTSLVLFIGEILKRSETYLGDGVHPRVIVDGIERAKVEALKFLEGFKITERLDRELFVNLVRSALNTKIHPDIANPLCEIIVDAYNTILKSTERLADGAFGTEEADLNMVEILTMKHRMSNESRLVRGMVLDHGARHPDMPERLENCYILTCNVSLEYEKSEVNAGFFYSNSAQKDKLAASERKLVDEKVKQVIALKKMVCTDDDGNDNGKTFVLINQKGIDPPSLDMLAKENIIALRRAKRRNMERLPLAVGGESVNSFDDLEPKDLGYAGKVYQQKLGEDTFTFIEDVAIPQSCTILLKGPNDYQITQTKDAIRDGLRACLNLTRDKAVVPGGGAFEMAAAEHLVQWARTHVSGKAKLGVQVFADGLLAIPRALLENSGFDVQDGLLKIQEAHIKDKKPYGVDTLTGDPLPSDVSNVWDNYIVKSQMVNIGPVLAQQLLLVDEVIRAGKQMGGNGQ